MSLNVVINTGVVTLARKNPHIYDSTVKYIIGQTQRHLKLIYNPAYNSKVLTGKEKKLKFYEIEKTSLSVKKEYEEAKGGTIVPKRINVITEEEKKTMARKRLEERAKIEGGGEKEKAIPNKKKDIIYKPKNTEIKEKNSFVKEEKKSKSKLKFEVLKEEVNYESMVYEKKLK